MDKVIKSDAVKDSLAALGWSQKDLAAQLNVTAQAVTNWLQGKDFPRPDTLLKLATTLNLRFEQLVQPSAQQPVIAFRKKAGAKTTDKHLVKAMAMGAMLKPLVEYLPSHRVLRTQILSPSTDYDLVQNAAAAVRQKLGIGPQAVLEYHHLIKEFQLNDAVIVPVMWGEKKSHENALHIFLPEENVTFIYLNLDTYLEDFKFWMTHELAHVYTQAIAGKEEGEDFADAFAGALLFPKELAQACYAKAIRAGTVPREIEVLRECAAEHEISLYSVFCEVKRSAEQANLPQLKVTNKDIHAVRNNIRGSLVSKSLFNPMPPDAAAYVAAADTVFDTPFFGALQRMLIDRNTGAGYVQQLLNVSIKDASALYSEWMH